MTQTREIKLFLAGAVAGTLLGALGAYVSLRAASNTETTVTTPSRAAPADLLMPGDSWPTTTELQTVSGNGGEHGGTTGAPQQGTAGSLEEVTRNLAQRLAAKGGTAAEWRLLAQSYDYLGRSDAARAARQHLLNE